VDGISALDLIAHELRTPLSVIRGYVSLIEDGTFPVPDRTRDEAIAPIASKAKELEMLIDVLYFASRLEGGQLPRRPQRFDIAEAVHLAVDEIADRARLEWATIDSRLPETPLAVWADRSHVVRILVNLLNNALTYSRRPATVTVGVRHAVDVEVVVRDRGIGIAADRQRAVFERFQRVGSDAPRFTAGLGLGLPLSRQLAVLNGGSLTLERSAPGEGSTFVLRLPAA
jgi:signal transduction histidine kinase